MSGRSRLVRRESSELIVLMINDKASEGMQMQ